jgi:hypothetical protein
MFLLLMPLLLSANDSDKASCNFLQSIFPEEVPNSKTLWLETDIRKQAEELVQHPLPMLRVRYWQKGETTAWILQEIGKEKPITFGIVIKNGAILKLEVLAFRESRGGEIRQPFFTKQFSGAAITTNGKLSQTIDGITGATLSVGASKRSAILALYLDSLVRQESVTAP